MNKTQAPVDETAVAKVVDFAQRFGQPSFALACHASFPLVLTPDLLYRIWGFFVREAPWSAVADVLLSSLCHEVGYELYEMSRPIRKMLLEELQSDSMYGQD